jgi:hypothetical protein
VTVGPENRNRFKGAALLKMDAAGPRHFQERQKQDDLPGESFLLFKQLVGRQGLILELADSGLKPSKHLLDGDRLAAYRQDAVSPSHFKGSLGKAQDVEQAHGAGTTGIL